VRRLRPGDGLTVGDGHGRFRAVHLGVTLAVAGPIESEPRPSPTLTVGFALTKGDRPELAVQKLTELGVDVVAPFTSARTVVRWDAAKAARNLARWRAIAREAAAQCHRPWLPVVADLTGFGEVARLADVALAHPDGAGPSLDRPAVLVGPEGGWSADEEAAVPHRACLGPHVLRAETAAVVAGALLAALRGGQGGPLVRSILP
jgi:16S rRNA (uracil1498-N3)-methyltransferase